MTQRNAQEAPTRRLLLTLLIYLTRVGKDNSEFKVKINKAPKPVFKLGDR